MTDYEKVRAAKIDSVTPSLIGNCKRLIHILENIGSEELAQRHNYKLRAEVKNKVKEIRRDTLALERGMN